MKRSFHVAGYSPEQARYLFSRYEVHSAKPGTALVRAYPEDVPALRAWCQEQGLLCAELPTRLA